MISQRGGTSLEGAELVFAWSERTHIDVRRDPPPPVGWSCRASVDTAKRLAFPLPPRSQAPGFEVRQWDQSMGSMRGLVYRSRGTEVRVSIAWPVAVMLPLALARHRWWRRRGGSGFEILREKENLCASSRC
jgi:hypothetical protein